MAYRRDLLEQACRGIENPLHAAAAKRALESFPDDVKEISEDAFLLKLGQSGLPDFGYDFAARYQALVQWKAS